MGTGSNDRKQDTKTNLEKEINNSSSKHDKTSDISFDKNQNQIQNQIKNKNPPELFDKNMLKYHNEYRIKHHSIALENTSELNNKANKYAELLLRDNVGDEGNNLFNDDIYGENIFITDREECEENICKIWYDENKRYNYDLNNFQRGTNHFTQLVWNSTRKIGFGYANYNNKYCYVTLYYPAGNILGQFTNNVFKI